jgi:hypothetical protein
MEMVPFGVTKCILCPPDVERQFDDMKVVLTCSGVCGICRTHFALWMGTAGCGTYKCPVCRLVPVVVSEQGGEVPGPVVQGQYTLDAAFFREHMKMYASHVHTRAVVIDAAVAMPLSFDTLVRVFPQSGGVHMRVWAPHRNADRNNLALYRMYFARMQAHYTGMDNGWGKGVLQDLLLKLADQLHGVEVDLFMADAATPDIRIINPGGYRAWEMHRPVAARDAFLKSLGRALGHVLVVDGAVLPVDMSLMLWKAILGQPISLQDLCDAVPDYLANRFQPALDVQPGQEHWLYAMEFAVDFACMYGPGKAEGQTPCFRWLGDADEQITYNNRVRYVQEHLDCLMQHQVMAAAYIRAGLAEVVDVNLVTRWLSVQDVVNMCCGVVATEEELATEKWRRVFAVGYGDGSPQNAEVRASTMDMFWRFIDDHPQHRMQVLKYMTGYTRLPVGGLERLVAVLRAEGKLSPQYDGKLAVEVYTQSNITNRLPSAHMCYGVLDIPACPAIVAVNGVEQDGYEYFRDRFYHTIYCGADNVNDGNTL